MFSVFDNQLLTERAEQSRTSYNLQTEDFRNLNSNLLTYLEDIRTTDDENHQLQDNIDQIRTSYIATLENHLTRLPNDFRQESQILTEAHVERYKSKSRARRFLNEREELKRRIHFVAGNEKEQTKRFNSLQKQQRSVQNEFMMLNEQIQRLLLYVENEKQTHRQAMDKVDSLQMKLEQTCVERSKTEFEIQSLKEEVKLMQTASEFLDEERETILATQTEANEYLLSRLNQSITRIREDFTELNQSQLKQTENEYKQMLQILEENLLTAETSDDTTIHSRTLQTEREQLQDVHRSALEELTTLTDHNQTLSEHVLAMETDLYSVRDERMRQLGTKDNELQRGKIDLQTLNEKLNHLAEYDRNLKFELTLYRGVLESEYRRKQQQKQSSIPTSQSLRPTTLRSSNNSMTDRTIWLTSSTNQSKFNNNQQQQETLTTRNRVQSEYDSLGELTNVQTDDIISTITQPDKRKLASEKNLTQPWTESLNQDEIYTNVTSQANQHTPAEVQHSPADARKTSISFPKTVLTDDQSISPVDIQQLSSRTSSTSAGTSSDTRRSPASSTTPTLPEDHSTASQVRRSPTTPSEHQSLPTVPPFDQVTLPTNTALFPSKGGQSPSSDHQTLIEVEQPSSRTSSISAGTSFETQRSPPTSTTPTVAEYQISSADVRQLPSTPPDNRQMSSELQQSSSRTSSIGDGTSFETQRSNPSDNTSTVPAYQPPSPGSRQSPSTPPNNRQMSSELQQTSSRTSSIGDGTSFETQRSDLLGDISTVPEYQPSSSDIHRSPSTPPNSRQISSELHQSSSRTSSISAETPFKDQSSPSSVNAATVPENQSPSPDVRQSPSTPPDNRQISYEFQQSSSPTSSISAETLFKDQRSPSSVNAATVPENQPPSPDVRRSPSTPPNNRQIPYEFQESSSRTSSIGDETSFETRRSNPSDNTSTVPAYQPASPGSLQSPSTPTNNRQISSELQQTSSRTSSIGDGTSFETQRSNPLGNISTVSEYQPSSSDIHQSPSTLPNDRQISSEFQQSSSRTSSISAEIPFKDQRSPSSATVSENQPLEDRPTLSDVEQSASTSFEQRQMSSEVQQSPTTKTSTVSTDIQEQTSPVTADDYKGTTSMAQTRDFKTSPTTSIASNFGSENHLGNLSVEMDDNFKYEESTAHDIDEKTTDESDRQQSIHPFEPSSMEEFEISLDIRSNQPRSPSSELISTPRHEREPSLSESMKDNQSELNQAAISNQTTKEEVSNSSLPSKSEEYSSTENISSTTTSDTQHTNNLNEVNPSPPQDASKQSSHDTSLTNVEEVDLSTSQKLEIRSDDDNDPSLAVIMQDLRFVFHELANDQDLVEIDNDLPDKLLDRLEFRDHIIRTLFDNLLRKYLVQAAAQENRSETLDWIEFKDILFPIITGRYIERHIRALFDLFDTGRDGYLSLQEIAELLEILQANDTIDLAQSIIDEYDTDHDGKLSVDELIEAIKKTDDINEHELSEETENKQWFNQSPTENQTISLEVPIVNFSSKPNEKFTKGIPLLGRIFKKVGADSDNKQLDSHKKSLSMQITNELITNNISISSDDLQLFIQLFLDQKQNTEPIINWIEFRDVLLPIITEGFYSNNDIKRWFEIIDTNHDDIITREQTIHLLRLLQIQNPDEIISKLNQTAEIHTDNNAPWTLDELTFALDNVDETASRILSNNEQIQQTDSFDIDWLSKNIF